MSNTNTQFAHLEFFSGKTNFVINHRVNNGATQILFDDLTLIYLLLDTPLKAQKKLLLFASLNAETTYFERATRSLSLI